MNFFNLNSPIIRAINKIIDFIWLGILWAIACIPVVTIGASTAATHSVMTKSIRDGKGYVTSLFFTEFKNNFKQSTILFLIWLALEVVLSLDLSLTYNLYIAHSPIGNFIILAAFLMLLSTAWGGYLYSYTVTFEDDIKTILKNTIYFVFKHPLCSISNIVIFFVAAFFISCFPFFVSVIGSIALFFNNIVLEFVYSRYMDDDEEQSDN